jgi:mannose-6-phosphate isomerase
MLYPLKFKPLFKDKIWGGQKINKMLGYDFSPLPNCGEAWVLSGVAEGQTVVANGFLEGNDLNEVLEIYMDELVGEKVYDHYKNEFPILVKVIDANDWLSIQVHPDDELAAKRNIGRGKTEMWYILDADQNAELITGFNQKMTREKYLESVNANKLKEVLNFEKVSKGDLFFIPAGRVHALGPGILLAEIQQTSDTTYRIYDWDRVDAAGNPRDLHTALAVDAIDFTTMESYRTPYTANINKVVPVVESPYFTTNILTIDKQIEKDYADLDSFVILVVVEGKLTLEAEGIQYPLATGEIILLPAITEQVLLLPDGKATLLEVYIG